MPHTTLHSIHIQYTYTQITQQCCQMAAMQAGHVLRVDTALKASRMRYAQHHKRAVASVLAQQGAQLAVLHAMLRARREVLCLACLGVPSMSLCTRVRNLIAAVLHTPLHRCWRHLHTPKQPICWKHTTHRCTSHFSHNRNGTGGHHAAVGGGGCNAVRRGPAFGSSSSHRHCQTQALAEAVQGTGAGGAAWTCVYRTGVHVGIAVVVDRQTYMCGVGLCA